MAFQIPGVNSAFGPPGYNGSDYMKTFNSWGINGGSPDVPSVDFGDGLTSYGNPAAYPSTGTAAVNGGMFSGMSEYLPDFLTNGSIFDQTGADGSKAQGWGMPALGAMSSLFSGYMASEKLNLAQEQFDFQKKAYEQNYAAKRSATNSALEDRQRARVASGNNYESVGDYMNKYGIK